MSMISNINWRSRRLLVIAGLVPVLMALATMWGVFGLGNSGTAVATTGEITSKEDAASHGIAIASAGDNITARNVYVGEMTWAEYISNKGGELGSTIQGRDDAVWVVVIEPEGLIVKPDRHGSSTYATYQVAFRKTDGGVVGVSYRFPGKATVVPMTEDNKVARD
jgi:hypothetical protein